MRLPKTTYEGFNSPNIFQENISKLFKWFDMVRAHTENVLVITKDEFINHLKALEIVSQKLAEAVL